MPSSRRIASGNPTLTQFAAGLSQDLSSAMAEYLAPRVPVNSTVGQYKKFDDTNQFQTYDTARAIGGKARRIEFNASDPTYNAQPQALEIPIDDAERDAEGDFPLSLQQAKTKTLVNSAILGHDAKVITLAKTVTAVASIGEWTNNDNDPVAEVDDQIVAFVTATGRMPNRIAIGLGAWNIIRNNEKVVERLPDITVKSVNLLQVANMFINPSIEIKIGVLVANTVKVGGTQSNALQLDKDFFLFYAEQSPTQYDPSWMKTFMPANGSVESVRQYREEGCRSDILALDWSEDIKITGSLCCKRITVT